MLNIVELREMSDDRLEEMIENSREEMFNLRFQKASARLENYARLKQVRRELAQLQSVLHMRRLAVEAAVQEPEVANALLDKLWQANARFDYVESAWQVIFADEDDNELATVLVNLNKKKPQGRKARRTNKQPRLVKSYEIAG